MTTNTQTAGYEIVSREDFSDVTISCSKCATR
jgi:hypothetical protein